MPDWLMPTISEVFDLSLAIMAERLVVALVGGFLVAGIYRLVRSQWEIAPSFPATLVLLTILCAMLPQIIGQNVAWAFGLVGALSIVRFRTAIEDTKDIAFVIFSVLIGMAVGAGEFPVAGLGIVVVGVAALATKSSEASSIWNLRDAKLTVRVPASRNPNDVVAQPFAHHFERFDLASGSTCKQGALLELVYKVRLKTDSNPTDIIASLNRVEAIESVELRRG